MNRLGQWLAIMQQTLLIALLPEANLFYMANKLAIQEALLVLANLLFEKPSLMQQDHIRILLVQKMARQIQIHYIYNILNMVFFNTA
jgi:hypothetical protein